MQKQTKILPFIYTCDKTKTRNFSNHCGILTEGNGDREGGFVKKKKKKNPDEEEER